MDFLNDEEIEKEFAELEKEFDSEEFKELEKELQSFNLFDTESKISKAGIKAVPKTDI